MSDSKSQSAEFPVESLTRREREVLALLAEGLTAPEIAEKLTLAITSVRTHMQHLYAKLGVNSKSQALKRARELGLLKRDPHAPQAFPPPPRSPTTRPGPPDPAHNLPVQVTRFFGRESEMGQIKQRLAEWRLVTLTGPGGVGKTRLCLQVADEVLDHFPDGVWFVDLTPLSDPTLVAQQVVTRLGVHDEPGQPMLESLMAFLGSRQVLLVLDNCEHLLEACARLADSLLHACPRLRLLASSREPLGIAGEAAFPVPSLPFPDPDHLPAIDRLDGYTALSLFVDRARAVRPGYQLAAHNASALARICQRLDGIPLALELAAARLRLLDTNTLEARLDDAFGLLTGGSRTALPRHQTLRATIDWSYQLLSEEERLLLQRLSVFAGGCTLEAAEVVCSGGSLEASQVLDRLAGLVDKSMVIADRRQGEETRYRLLEMVQQYAREKLEAAGETARLQTHHRDYFLTLAETTRKKILTRERPVWGRKFLAEPENFRLALDWSLSEHEDSDVEAGLKLLNPVMGIAEMLFSPQENFDWCNRAVVWCQSHTGISNLVYARLLGLRARATAEFDLPSGVAGLKEAVEFSRRLGPDGKTVLMQTLVDLGSFLASLDDIEQAQAASAEAEAILHELGLGHFSPEEYVWHRANFVGEKARLSNKQGRYADAKMYAAESIRLAEENGHPWRVFGGQLEIGHACLELGEYDQARAYFIQALNVITVRNFFAQSYVKRCLGFAELGLGNLDPALAYCQASVRDAHRGLSKSGYIGTSLGLAALIAAKQDQPIRAATLSGASQARYATTGRKPWEDSSLDTLLPGWRDGPDQAEILQAFEAGQAMTVDQAVAYALETELPA